MKIKSTAGITSKKIRVCIKDSTSTVDGGKTGLVYNTSGLTAYYFRDGDTSSTSISLVTASLGTWTSGGFKEIDSTNMPGVYEIGVPNAVLSVAGTTQMILRGATGMVDCRIEFELDAVNYQSQTSFITGTNGQAHAYDTNNFLKVDVVDIAGTASAGTAGYVALDWGHINAPTTVVDLTNTTLKGIDGVTFPSTVASPTNITAGTITTVTNQLTAAAIATGVWTDTTSGDFTTASSIGKSLFTSGAVPGAAGGLFIAGTNAATSITTGLTAHIIGTVDTVTTVTNQLTAAAIATGIWQDATAGDFTVASSIGKSLYIANIVPGAAGGHFIAGSNAATTVNFTGSLSGSVGSVTGAVGSVTGAVGSISGVTFPTHFSSILITAAGNVGIDWANVANPSAAVNLSATTTNLVNTATTVTNQLTAAAIATGIWQDATAGDFTTASSIGKSLYTGNHAPGAASGLPLVGSQMDLVNAPNATAVTAIQSGLATPTNITAGTIANVTNLTNAPTSGDFTATMKSSLNAATPASVTGAVGSVTGNVGGNVVGSVGSVTAGVTVTTNNDKTGYSLANGSIVTATFGTCDFTSTMKTSIAASTWSAVAASYDTAGTMGAELNAAGGSGDPWATSVPGSYGPGQAGYIVGNSLNATVASRMATYTQPTGFLAATFPSGTVANTTNITGGTITTTTNLTNLPSIPAGWLTASGINAGALDGKGDWTVGNVTVGAFSVGAITSAAFAAAAITSTVAPNLDAAVSSRSTYAGADTPTSVKLATMLATSGSNYTYTSDSLKNVLDGLDTTAPTAGPISGWTFRQRLTMLFRRMFTKTAMTASTLTQYADDGSTAIVAQALSDDGTTQTQATAA